MELKEEKPKLLLHVCCAVCGAYLTEILKSKFTPAIYFYNPNIHPKEEYEKRKDSAKKLAEIYQVGFIEEAYDPEKWFENVKNLEEEPEGGKRCPICFETRLLKTAEAAQKRKIKNFTTTLAVSPYKNENIINQIGHKVAKDLPIDFIELSNLDLSKKEIWQRSRDLARKYNFYRQKYCGCIFAAKKQA